jgi:hypothetical protein
VAAANSETAENVLQFRFVRGEEAEVGVTKASEGGVELPGDGRATVPVTLSAEAPLRADLQPPPRNPPPPEEAADETKKASPRLIARLYGASKWDLIAPDLRAFRKALGGDLLVAFTRCFIFADRIESLIAWEYLSQKHLEGHTVQQHRNFDTFLWFTFATLREFAKAATHLETELRSAGLFDEALWERSLGQHDAPWAKDSRVQLMRDKGGAHVDLALLSTGLDAIESGKHPTDENALVVLPKLGPGLQLMKGDDEERRQDSAFVLGSAAILSGLGLPPDELQRVVDEPIKKFNAAAALFDVFLDVLRRRGLDPLGFTRTEHPDEEKPEPVSGGAP